MAIPGKLKGKDQEIMALYDSGISEYKIAVLYGVYPFAIRRVVARIKKQREEVQLAGGK